MQVKKQKLELDMEQQTSSKSRKTMPRRLHTFIHYHTVALISHANKAMFKILQARLQSMLTKNPQKFKLDLEKAEEPETKLPMSDGS